VVVVDGRERPDGGVELSVRDNGQGIPAEHRERVFGGLRAPGRALDQRRDRDGAGHLPQDRRGPWRCHRHRGRPRDGEQALDRLARARFEAGGLPQLVLLDLKMPRMGGLEVLGHLRADEITRDLPVVVLTCSEHREDREEALRPGVTWFVCKPTGGRRLRSEIQQLADHGARVTS
jgi:CheY-like chemotaxis protein